MCFFHLLSNYSVPEPRDKIGGLSSRGGDKRINKGIQDKQAS